MNVLFSVEAQEAALELLTLYRARDNDELRRRIEDHVRSGSLPEVTCASLDLAAQYLLGLGMLASPILKQGGDLVLARDADDVYLRRIVDLFQESMALKLAEGHDGADGVDPEST